MSAQDHARHGWLRRNGVFLVALALGVAIRAVVTYAYRPALIFPDSFGYLSRADPFRVFDARPSGYSLFLWPFVQLPHSRALIALTQHGMGLLLAVVCYVFLARRGLPRWAATLAVVPLLLDPLQLVLEHYLLSDTLFESLLVGACLLVLWQRRPGIGNLVVAGLFIGCSAFVRGAGSFLVVVFVVALLCLRVRWTRVVAFVVAAAIPIAGYAVAFHAQYGSYAISTSGPRFLYARIAPVVECDTARLQLPSYEQMLCPNIPVGRRPSTDWYMWGLKQGPQWHVVPPPGMTALQVIKDFDQRVLRAEPVVYATAVTKDVVRGFLPVRTVQVPGYPSSYWLFKDHYWTPDTFIRRGVLLPRVRYGTSYDPATASFMQTYRTWIYTPGPLMAVLLLLAIAGTLGLGRARRSGDRVATGLLAAACLLPLVTAAGLSGFSWRYQLPQIALIPMAGALGLAALLRGPGPGRPPGFEPLRPLDRIAGRVATLPLPAAWRDRLGRASERGSLQVVVALLLGLAVAVVVAAGATGSGWAAAGTAAALGLVAGILAVLTLLVARSRAGSAPPPDCVAREDPAHTP